MFIQATCSSKINVYAIARLSPGMVSCGPGNVGEENKMVNAQRHTVLHTEQRDMFIQDTCPFEIHVHPREMFIQ